jgi:hypothetical protein
MNWQRINLPIRPITEANSSMQTNLLYLLNDAELGRCRKFNRIAFIEHGINLDAEVNRMVATARRLHQYHIYPSMWLYTDPRTTSQPITTPFVLSRTWLHERPANSESLYWLSVFQVFDVDRDQTAIKQFYERRKWFPYKETILRDGGAGFRLA